MTIKKTKFYKRISVLLVSVLFTVSFLLIFYTQEISAQEENYCIGATPTFNRIELGAEVSWLGTASNLNDDDTNTFIGFGDKVSGGAVRTQFEGIVTFASPISEITRVEYEGSWNVYGTNSINPREMKAYLWYSGGSAWHEIDSWQTTIGTAAETSFLRDVNGPWYNVEKVKVYVSAWSGSRTCRKAEGCDFRWILRELRAFGPPAYQDIGLRVYDGTNIVKIAVEPDTGNPGLKIAEGGIIYDVVLVNQGDAMDSGVGIQTSSGIKALRKYE